MEYKYAALTLAAFTLKVCSWSNKKEVRWKLTVDECVIRNPPESCTSPLPKPASLPFTNSPPPPQPNQNLCLPGTLEIHPFLTSVLSPRLDFSFPSDAFRRDPRLTHTLLNDPACTPPQASVHLRISAGLYAAEFDVVHTPRGQAVTVGDVLTAIQTRVRQYDYGHAPPEATPYMRRRIATVNGYCQGRDVRTEAANIVAESQGGGRFVDHLLGHTLFAGLTPQLGQPECAWQVELVIPERYAYWAVE